MCDIFYVALNKYSIYSNKKLKLMLKLIKTKLQGSCFFKQINQEIKAYTN